MTKNELQRHRTNLRYRLAFYSIGLVAAVILAVLGSQYAGEAFALIGGLIGGGILEEKVKS